MRRSRTHIRRVIARLREQKYLEDARYALDLRPPARNSRRQGRFRIARELRARGVPDRHIDAALEAVFAETDEAALVRARLKRRLAHLRGPLITSASRLALSQPAPRRFSSRHHSRRTSPATREHEAPLPAFAFPDPPADE